MAKIKCIVNREEVILTQPGGKSLLDVLRNDLAVFGAKEGCREGECGACTVLIGREQQGRFFYRAVPSCLTPVGQVQNCHIVTVEGLDLGTANPFQQAMIDEGGSQCGFCTPGFIQAFTGYLLSTDSPEPEEAMNSLDGNICRCTGYQSIKRAVLTTLKPLPESSLNVETLIDAKLIPPYFKEIPTRLKKLETDPVAEGTSREGLIAGGTDIMIQKGDSLADQDVPLIFPGGEIELQKKTFRISAKTTMEELRLNEDLNRCYPGMKQAFTTVASHILRNRATLGGNVVNASPIADGAVLLLGLSAEVEIRKGETLRRIPLGDFFKGYKILDLEEGEILSGFLIPSERTHWHFRKVSKREKLDIASCNSALSLNLEKGKITSLQLAFGGVAPVPYLARKTMAFLEGQAPDRGLFDKAIETLSGEIAPIDDIRGSADYKRNLAAAILEDHFQELFPELYLKDQGAAL